MRIVREADAPARAWRSHRRRVREWLDVLPESEWSGATRCGEWDVAALVRHLASGSQFLGYTLHQAAREKPTELLRDFDSQETAKSASGLLGDLSPAVARQTLASMDASVEAELGDLEDSDWSAMAEAPLGNVPSHLSVNHFLFDSWVHEYDLMIPRGDKPAVERAEVEVVLPYLIALVGVGTGSRVSLDVRVVDCELRIGSRVHEGITVVEVGTVPSGASVVEGSAQDIVDRATGRVGGVVDGDELALAVLDRSGRMMAG
jgi:uncharacterized protein (TIGR03083 family)